MEAEMKTASRGCGLWCGNKRLTPADLHRAMLRVLQRMKTRQDAARREEMRMAMFEDEDLRRGPRLAV